ncbi:hypothetical protein ACIHFE_28410 [Streptomyces sp. NPDC052396]|uniref:transmembrane-type terpene cyclase n=1 Tax=Streptomyces sp. NPDC052396 TaxID=3365689 RepID=UPI0037D5F135
MSFVAGYALNIRRGYKDRTYCVPLAGVALSPFWDARYVTGHYHSWLPLPTWLFAVYIGGHLLVFAQVAIYGPAEFPHLPRGVFYAMVAAFMLMAGAGMLQFEHLTHDTWGVQSSLLCQAATATMSPMMLYHRQSLRGQSIPGNALNLVTSVCCWFAFIQYPPPASGLAGSGMLRFTICTAVVMCAVYLACLLAFRHQHRAKEVTQANPARITSMT